MKKTRLFKVLTSAVLTGAMVMSMSGMTAFADTKEIDLTKIVTTDGNTYAPATNFTFEISNGAAGKKGVDVVYQGLDNGLLFSNGTTISEAFSFGPTVEGMTTVEESYSVTKKIKADTTPFSEPGIYHYVLKEKIPVEAEKYDGIKYDETEYQIYVYIERNTAGDLVVAGVVASATGKTDSTLFGKGENGEKTKSSALEFTNDYGKDLNNDKVHDLKIKKVVSGNQGQRDVEFNFKVTVSGAKGEYYKVAKIGTDGTETTLAAALLNGVEASYTLKHDESIRIYGLSETDTCRVEEVTDNKLDGYMTTIKDKDSNVIEDKDGNKLENLTSSRVLEGKTVSADGDLVTYNNNKDVTTPTGIALSFAPYILMVALAGVFAVLFLRKRREEF